MRCKIYRVGKTSPVAFYFRTVITLCFKTSPEENFHPTLTIPLQISFLKTFRGAKILSTGVEKLMCLHYHALHSLKNKYSGNITIIIYSTFMAVREIRERKMLSLRENKQRKTKIISP